MRVTPESFRSIQNPLGVNLQASKAIAVLCYQSRFMVGQMRLIFRSIFTELPTSLLPPRGCPDRYSRLCDTAFDRFVPMSPDRILGMDATPAPRSGAVLPSSLAGFLAEHPECLFDF
jgi:hypothetical protein